MNSESPIVLTRSSEDCEYWAASLNERGIETVSLPCIETEEFRTASLQSALSDAVADAHWLVMTSQRGVTAVADLLDRQLPDHLAVAVVGAGSARHARTLLGRCDLVAKVSSAAGLANELAERVAHSARKIVLALAENAGDVLFDTLTAAGQHCRRFDVYRTIPASASGTRRTLADIGGHTIFLASPSAVLGFVNQVAIDDSARLISIGPTTSAAIERAGLQVYAQAATPSLSGMLDAIKD